MNRNLIGSTFGFLTVVAKAKNKLGEKTTTYVCRCVCGKEKELQQWTLLNRKAKSCGCKKPYLANGAISRHGKHNTPEYRSWSSMRDRCLNKNCESYPYYGGRGITICDRWNKFENFLADMGVRPTLIHSLDRMNVNGNYDPSNCRWATRKQQSETSRPRLRRSTAECQMMRDYRDGKAIFITREEVEGWECKCQFTLQGVTDIPKELKVRCGEPCKRCQLLEKFQK